jgi:radical SAM superfamily enzyme YgiQ (UPF0313 family)
MMVTLLYPPQQSDPRHGHKPEAALAYPYLSGALKEAGHDVACYDACVGNSHDPENVFDRETVLPSGLVRYGVSDDRILEEVADSDIVGITSIFTAQETMALHVGRIIKNAYPDKLVVAGGVNAASRPHVFFASGFDVVCRGEAETSILDIADSPLTYLGSRRVLNSPVVVDLDELPMPDWTIHPNDRYWKIGRPHGAKVNDGPFRYAPLMTSRGCVFRCAYCHITGDQETGRYRVKSIPRVHAELELLKELGVTDVFIEDDTLFGRKQRSIQLLRDIRGYGFRMWDINGINLPHLFRRSSGRFTPDLELLDVLQECRFAAISLPVESASQRIIDRYASRKWRVDLYPVADLICEMTKRGISAGVNYMIGYPDETMDEIQLTIDMARRHREAGASSANFMLVIPLPGSALHQEAIDGGYIDADFDPDTFNWRRASMKNTAVPPESLEEIHRNAWQELN